MQNRSPYDSDFLFAEQCLEGNSAALGRLQRDLAHTVEAFLMAAGVPRRESEEAVAELMTELLAPNETRSPLLATYHGQCALETWLNRAALSRAISRRRKEERYRKRVEAAYAEGALSDLHPSQEPHHDDLVRKLLRDAIQQAFADCSSDDFVIIHLLFGSNLHATEVARMFQCDWRTLRHRAESACAQVRFAVQAELQQRDAWLNLSWSEVLNLLTPDLPPLFDAQEPIP